jgi:hypothetical protein
MGKCMCKFKSSPLKIEYSSEDKVSFYFFRLFTCTFFFNFYFGYFNIFFIFFSIVIMHNLTFSFVFVDLPTKLSFSWRLCNSNIYIYIYIYYVTIGIIL